jgi:2-polyprenyl-6-methoxyphenol hydroxylase-like FAD-dependent oxidoreductase
MTPFTAQGATMALEDAGALLAIFSNISSKDDLPKRMQAYNKVRLARATRTMSSNSFPLRNGRPNPLVVRKQEYEDADTMLPKGLIGKEKLYWDYR